MSPQANCFQIKGAEIIPGLPPTSDVLEGTPLPWGELQSETIDPNGPRRNWVKHCLHRKSGTRWITGGHQQHEIDPHAGNIFYFDVPDLQFEEAPLLEGLNLWPGGEWHDARPFWRKAREDIDRRTARHVMQRAEIWVLKKQHLLLLVDQYGGVVKLCFAHEGWFLSTVQIEEVVDYLHVRGLNLTTHRGIMWALKNLELICREYPRKQFLNATHEVRERL